MEGLRLLIQVDPGKRHEFIQSAKALLPERDATGGGCQRMLLQAVDNEYLFCLIVEYQDGRDLAMYMHSDQYRALLGAAKVLGVPNNLDIAEYQPLTPKS